MVRRGIPKAALHPPFATLPVAFGGPAVRLLSGGVNRLLVIVPLDRPCGPWRTMAASGSVVLTIERFLGS
jgi:hypothetical protein